MRGSSSLIEELLASLTTPCFKTLLFFCSVIFGQSELLRKKNQHTRIKRGKVHPITHHEDREGE
jgi:hypothetical protein